MNRDYKQIGSFEMTDTIMRVSDPCYDTTTWCCGTIPNCLTGQWDSAVVYSDEGIMGQRIALLVAKHSGSVHSFDLCDKIRADEENIYYSAGWEVCGFEVGVDSGQAGFFDEAHYQDESVFAGHPAPHVSYGGLWYSHCCDRTLSEDQAGTIPYGVISCSGYGDGGYTALMHKTAGGQVDCVAIVYLAD